MSHSIFSQVWLDKSLYPFESKYIRLDAGNMHYIDEGEGEILLFVHGTPTWSFLFRDFVKELSTKYRCIAVDHLGFGLSEKPDAIPGNPEWHSDNLSEFINKLQLSNITLVVHDFGGPIGLGAGIKNSAKIKKVVLFNTWLWATKHNKDAQKIDNLVNSWLGKFLYLRLNVSPVFLLKKGFDDTSNLNKTVHQHYIRPFPNKESRRPLLHLAKALVGSSDWYQEQWGKIDRLAGKDWLILWGTKDRFLDTEYLSKWKNKIENATIRTFDCGHFVQEEKTTEAIKAIDEFITSGT